MSVHAGSRVQERDRGVFPPWMRAEALPLILLIGLTALGGLMRRYHLGQQSLWFDESDLVMRAHAPLPDLLRNFVHPGENGPLYTLALAVWMKALGISEIAVRLPSALAGTLAIPASYGLGRAMRGPRLGLIAAALLTVSPYAHWYAQDAKMYSLLVLLTIAATWLLLASVRRGGTRWVAYGVIAALALGVHAEFVLVLVAHIVIALALWRNGYGEPPSGRSARVLLVLIGVAALPLIVWGVIFTIRGGPTWQVQATPGAIVRRMLVEFSVTHRAGGAAQAWGAWCYTALAVVGVAATIVAARRSARVGHTTRGEHAYSPLMALTIAGAMVLVPVVLFILASLRRAVFEDRYLIVALPGFLLLVGLGFDGLLSWRPAWPLAVIGGAAALVLAWIPLHNVNFSTLPQKEDWREAYRHVAEHARAGDGVVIAPGYLRSTYAYYALRFPALQALPVATPPSLVDTSGVTDRALNAFFATDTRGWERAWLVESPERIATQDPTARIRGFYMDGITSVGQRPQTLFEERKFNGVSLDCFSYDGPFLADHLAPQMMTDAVFGDTGITLWGASLQTLNGQPTVARGAFAPLLLRWLAPDRPVREDLVVLVRLIDASGQEVARYDITPLDGHWPTSTWQPKDDPYDPHDLFISPALPPGRYRIFVGLAPANAPTQPLDIVRRDGSRADAGGLIAIMTIDVT